VWNVKLYCTYHILTLTEALDMAENCSECDKSVYIAVHLPLLCSYVGGWLAGLIMLPLGTGLTRSVGLTSVSWVDFGQ